MLGIYLPIILLILIALAFGLGSVVFSSLIGQKRYSEVKMAPYECGCEPIGSAHERFSIKFYTVAVAFLVFDIEVIFLYPWAVLYKKLGMYGAVSMGFFFSVLVIGLIYEWKKGGLEWE